MTLTLDLLPLLFGLISAASWGAGDFSGGLASRRGNVFVVVAVTHGVGMLLMLGLALALGEPVPPLSVFLWASLAGLFGGLGLLALYRALAIGQMGIAAPITAVLAAGLPVLFAAVTEGMPQSLQLAGFGTALVGIWFLSRPEKAVGRPQGLGLALAAGVGFGAFLILINQASSTGLFWPLVSAKATELALTLAVLVVRRPMQRAARGLVWLMLQAGIFDVGGNAFYLLAAQAGRLDVAAVLSSLYPASTVLLAWLLLKERVTRVQAVGIVAVLAAIPMIAVS